MKEFKEKYLNLDTIKETINKSGKRFIITLSYFILLLIIYNFFTVKENVVILSAFKDSFSYMDVMKYIIIGLVGLIPVIIFDNLKRLTGIIFLLNFYITCILLVYYFTIVQILIALAVLIAILFIFFKPLLHRLFKDKKPINNLENVNQD